MYKNGDQYHGHFVDDHFQGSGEMKYACGDVYSGDWVNSQCCGNGTYAFENGDMYAGQFVQDKFNGYGVMTWADGSSYEGEFRDDFAWGAGKYRGADGSEQIGHFHMGAYVGDYLDLISHEMYSLPCSEEVEGANSVNPFASIESTSDSGNTERSKPIPIAAPSKNIQSTVFMSGESSDGIVCHQIK
jgi:hypothetical protein